MDRYSEGNVREERRLRRERIREEQERQMSLARDLSRLRMQRENIVTERQLRRAERPQTGDRAQASTPQEQTMRRSITMSPGPWDLGTQERRSLTFTVHSAEQPFQHSVFGPVYSSTGSLYDQEIKQDLNETLDYTGYPDVYGPDFTEEEESVFESKESGERSSSKGSFANSECEYSYDLVRQERKRSLSGDSTLEEQESGHSHVLVDELLSRKGGELAYERTRNSETQERMRAASDGEVQRVLKERIKVEKELEMEDDPYRKSESDAQSRGYRYHQTDISKDNEGRRKVDARRQFKTDQPYVGTNQRGRQSMSLRRHYAENETGYGECYPVERELFRREKREPDVINTRRDGQSSGNMLEIVDNEIEFLDMKLKQMRKNSERLKQEMEEKVIIGEKWTHRTEMLPENISRRENKFVQRPIERGSYERNYTPRKHSKVPRASLINELESGILPQTEIETDKTEYRREYRPKWEDITERRDNEAKYCVDYLPRADRRAKIEEDVLPFITRQRSEAKGNYWNYDSSQNRQGDRERAVMSTRQFSPQTKVKQRDYNERNRREEYESSGIEYTTEITRQTAEKKLEKLQMQKKRIRAMKEREEEMKQKEIELDRRERQLRFQADVQSELEDIDPLEEELARREKELEEKMKKLRLREEKIINAESSRRDKSCSEEQNAVIEFESQKKATESTGTTNSTSVKDAPTEQNSSKIGTGMETSLQDKIIYFPREKEIKNESKSIDNLGSENNKETTERKPQLEQIKFESERKPTEASDTTKTTPAKSVTIDQKISKTIDRGTETLLPEKTTFFPKFSTFSGEDQKQRKESSFEEWKYEVMCCIKEGVHSQQAIAQAIRKSLTGKAKQVLINSGTTANIDEIMKKLERVFGNVASGESMMQEFYTATQGQTENAVAWGLRLEEIMKLAVDKGHVKAESTNKMLKNRFWKGLRSERLKNATRIHFFNTDEYQELLSRVREEENEMKLNAGVQHQPVNTNVNISKDRRETPETSKLDLLYDKLTEMEEDMKELKKKSEWQARPPRPYGQYGRRQSYDRNRNNKKKETEATARKETEVKQDDLNS